MFWPIFVVLFVGAHCGGLREPKFQVLTPNELMVELPHHENKDVLTFRIGIKRRDHETEDLELGENDIDKNRIFFYDGRLNLQQGDVVNYLLAFRTKAGYQAQTGRYVFDGVYYKIRRHRFRRDTSTISSTEASKSNVEDFEPTDTEVESRFGGGPHHPHGGWPRRDHGFNPFGPHRRGPPFGPHFPNRPPPYGPPNFGGDCNHPRFEPGQGRDNGRWTHNTFQTVQDHNLDYHCGICDKLRELSGRSSTTAAPDIDIRFAD